jgi:hypothetical protein
MRSILDYWSPVPGVVRGPICYRSLTSAHEVTGGRHGGSPTSNVVSPVAMPRADSPQASSSQARVDGLTLHGEDAEDALVDTMEAVVPDEAFERLHP